MTITAIVPKMVHHPFLKSDNVFNKGN